MKFPARDRNEAESGWRNADRSAGGGDASEPAFTRHAVCVPVGDRGAFQDGLEADGETAGGWSTADPRTGIDGPAAGAGGVPGEEQRLFSGRTATDAAGLCVFPGRGLAGAAEDSGALRDSWRERRGGAACGERGSVHWAGQRGALL